MARLCQNVRRSAMLRDALGDAVNITTANWEVLTVVEAAILDLASLIHCAAWPVVPYVVTAKAL